MEGRFPTGNWRDPPVLQPAAAAVSMAMLRPKVGLLETYAIWLVLLFVMVWPCAWYYRMEYRVAPGWLAR